MQHIKHYSLGLLVVFALLLGALISAQPALAKDGQMEGDGSKDHPYQIEDAEDLLAFAEEVNKPNYDEPEADINIWAKLMNDIDLNPSYTYNQSTDQWTDADGKAVEESKLEEWAPIADDSAYPYTGTFEGNGHTISGLFINNSSTNDDHFGLFGVIGGGGNVTNLTVEGSVTVNILEMFSGDRVIAGGVTGMNLGNVNNCTNKVNVTVTNNKTIYTSVGGVSGVNYGNVSNCSNQVIITATADAAYIGGVVGQNQSDGSIEICNNTGAVNGTGQDIYTGGVAGRNFNTISKCYNTGAVSGTIAGGVAGANSSTKNSGTVTSCYNTGMVTASSEGATIGGVVGANSNGTINGTVNGCYYLNTVAGSAIGDSSDTSENVASKTTEEFASGEVAWLLQDALGENADQAWGQKLSGETPDEYPVLTSDTSKKVYQVTFKDSGSTFATDYANSGDTATKPTDPTQTGYTFGGWYSDESLTDDWNFDTDTVTDDITLHAKWNMNQYTVTFNTNGGSAVKEQEIDYGGKVTKPEAPTQTGYTFAGWYSDANFNTPWNFDTNTVSGNMTLYAKWNINQYTVTFNTNGGSDVDSLSVDYGDTVTKPADPTRDGYTFAGWYSDESLATAWNFETDTVSKDTTLYAKWTEIPTYTVTVAASSHGSVTVNPTSAAAGEMVTLTIAPETGYTLSGLNVADANGTAITVNGSENTYTFTMPDSAVTVAATFRLIEEPVDPTPAPTPTPDPDPSGPSTGESDGWESIADEITAADDGDSITIDMNGETEVPAEIFEDVAGKDVDLVFDMGDGLSWSVNGQDIPEGTNLTDLDLGVDLGTDGIPVDVINAITGEKDSVQITLAYDGDFGFTLTLTAPLGEDNAGYWANLYHYDEDTEAMNFEAAAEIGVDGSVSLPLSHASQYAIVIDDHSHAATDVSEIFTDVPANHWAQAAVQYVYDNGLMTGVSDSEFAPEATTTRAMIVSMLARMENVTSAADAGFTDVAADDWYATAVNWAAANGIVNGISDDTFAPNTAITREQLAAMLMNYAQWKGQDTSARADLSGYSDVPSTWASEAVQWAVAEGLLAGVTDDELQPQGQATRAQVAAIMQRFLEA